MTEPLWKAPLIKKALDNMSENSFGRQVSQSIHEDICVSCGKPAVEFKDTLSRKEYRISGLCQNCQDIVFAIPEDEEE
jgi:uncharacterized CHY-type Zn-finger protein